MSGLPSVLLIPPVAATTGPFRSLERVAAITRRALRRSVRVIEPEVPVEAGYGPFVASLAPLRERIDAVMDLSGLGLTTPAMPEVPVLMWTLGSLPRGAPFLSTRRRFLKTSDSLLVNSSADLTILARTLDGSGPHAELIPFGVDLDTFHPARDPGERQECRQRFDLAPSAFVLVFAGRINVQKNLHSLLQLAAACRPALPELQVVIAGEEDNIAFKPFAVDNHGHRRWLGELARSLGLADRVRFTGALDDASLSSLLRASDLFVSLSLHHDENFGFAPVEAMAAGLPALVSDWGGYRDSVPSGTCGTRVPTFMTGFGVRAAWRRAIPWLTRCGTDAPLRHRLGAEGRAHVARQLSLDAFERRLGTAVAAAAARRGAPARTGNDAFRFHPLALRQQARSALQHLARERGGERFDPTWRGEDYNIYRFFAGPYASDDVSEVIAVPEDRPRLLDDAAIEGDLVIGSDPIWPTRTEVDPSQAAVLIAATSDATIAELALEADVGVDALCHTASLLARQGVLDLGRPFPFEPEPSY